MTEDFCRALEKVGGVAVACTTITEAVAYLTETVRGPLLAPPAALRHYPDLASRLCAAGVEVAAADPRTAAPLAAAGLTAADFAIAATGTVVIDSTDESVRLASTLPPVHFVLLDPRRIVADSRAAVPLLRRFHQQLPQAYLAYITGPSRTADIERVLTIGVHGPKALHVLLYAGMADE